MATEVIPLPPVSLPGLASSPLVVTGPTSSSLSSASYYVLKHRCCRALSTYSIAAKDDTECLPALSEGGEQADARRSATSTRSGRLARFAHSHALLRVRRPATYVCSVRTLTHRTDGISSSVLALADDSMASARDTRLRRIKRRRHGGSLRHKQNGASNSKHHRSKG